MDVIYVMNKTDEVFTTIDMKNNKYLKFNPKKPIPLDKWIGFKIWEKHKDILVILNKGEQEKYNDGYTILVTREQGIGDLILLEPVLRAMAEDGMKVGIRSMFPAVYEGNKSISYNYDVEEDIDLEPFDNCENIIMLSEQHSKRDVMHRTDIYATRFPATVKDKTPRLYVKGKSKLSKEGKKKYIGVQLDASSAPRQYLRGVEVCEELLEADYIPVVLGNRKYIKTPKGCVDFQGKTTVKEVFKIIKDLDGMIAVDSGLMHVALVLKVPTVCLFGIIKPELRVKYYKGKMKLSDTCQFIGCGSKHGNKCRLKERECLKYDPKKIIKDLRSLNV